jgi:hypothetical protein
MSLLLDGVGDAAGSAVAACLPAESATVHPAVPGGDIRYAGREAAQDFVGVVQFRGRVVRQGDGAPG